jgi:hypothetical protein
VALTKFRTAQPFGPYLHYGNNLDPKEKLAKAFGPDQLALVELPGIEPVTEISPYRLEPRSGKAVSPESGGRRWC